MIDEQVHDSVEEAKARVLNHAMRFAEISMDGDGDSLGMLAELVRACEVLSAATAMQKMLVDARP